MREEGTAQQTPAPRGAASSRPPAKPVPCLSEVRTTACNMLAGAFLPFCVGAAALQGADRPFLGCDCFKHTVWLFAAAAVLLCHGVPLPGADLHGPGGLPDGTPRGIHRLGLEGVATSVRMCSAVFCVLVLQVLHAVGPTASCACVFVSQSSLPALLLPPLSTVLPVATPLCADPFWHSVPTALFWPMLVVATAASVVASQALISGVFSIMRQVSVSQTSASQDRTGYHHQLHPCFVAVRQRTR
jgi:hypothetical protein